MQTNLLFLVDPQAAVRRARVWEQVRTQECGEGFALVQAQGVGQMGSGMCAGRRLRTPDCGCEEPGRGC